MMTEDALRLRRMIAWVVGSSTILIAVHAQAARRADLNDFDAASHASCLVLEWMDPHELLPAGERWMAKETTRILGAAEIPSKWDWSDANDNGNASASKAYEHRVRVVLLPSEPAGPGWGLTPNTLGTTVMDGINAPPAVYIFYRSVVSLLSRDGRTPDLAKPQFLGPASRVLGRVVAHEVAHALAPSEEHASSGLMQAGLAPALLTAKHDLTIDEQWQRALGAGLSQLCSASTGAAEETEPLS